MSLPVESSGGRRAESVNLSRRAGRMKKLEVPYSKRMKDLEGRFAYVICDFSKPGWSKKLTGPFEAIVSSIAIHNVSSPKIIRAIYEEIFLLITAGGCFLNFDRVHSALEDQLKWLRGAGFKNVNCFWKSDRRAVFGGFKPR